MPDETPTPDDARPHPEHRSDTDANADGHPSARDDADADSDTAASERTDGQSTDTPPEPVVDEAERLTRLAREAVDDNEAAAYREDRAELLAEHGYTARVREDETRDVLVCHPAEWVVDGTVRPDRVDDVDRGIERPLSGPGERADWETIDAHNREVVAAVREAHGDDHAANVAALADFVGNHYAKPVEEATRAELEEFLTDYYPRNVWPTPGQRDIVEKSVVLAFDAVGERPPIERPR